MANNNNKATSANNLFNKLVPVDLKLEKLKDDANAYFDKTKKNYQAIRENMPDNIKNNPVTKLQNSVYNRSYDLVDRVINPGKIVDDAKTVGKAVKNKVTEYKKDPSKIVEDIASIPEKTVNYLTDPDPDKDVLIPLDIGLGAAGIVEAPNLIKSMSGVVKNTPKIKPVNQAQITEQIKPNTTPNVSMGGDNITVKPNASKAKPNTQNNKTTSQVTDTIDMNKLPKVEQGTGYEGVVPNPVSFNELAQNSPTMRVLHGTPVKYDIPDNLHFREGGSGAASWGTGHYSTPLTDPNSLKVADAYSRYLAELNPQGNTTPYYQIQMRDVPNYGSLLNHRVSFNEQPVTVQNAIQKLANEGNSVARKFITSDEMIGNDFMNNMEFIYGNRAGIDILKPSGIKGTTTTRSNNSHIITTFDANDINVIDQIEHGGQPLLDINSLPQVPQQEIPTYSPILYEMNDLIRRYGG